MAKFFSATGKLLREALLSSTSHKQDVPKRTSAPTSTMPFRFLALPTELRLQVYQNLIMSSIRSKQTCHIQGALTSCHQIHQEMEDYYISKARPLLEVMHSWKITSAETRSIDILFAHRGSFDKLIQSSTIEIPTAILPSQHKTFANPEPWRTTVEALRHAFRLPHSTLTIHVSGSPNRIQPYHVGNLYWLIYCLHAFADGSPSFARINRLILECEPRTSFTDVDVQHCMKLLLVSMYEVPKLVTKLRNSACFPEVVSSWVVTRSRDVGRSLTGTLNFGFDFVKDLPKCPGAKSYEGALSATH
jgi:hypothetical protein